MVEPSKLKQVEMKFRVAWTHGTLPDLIRVAAVVLTLAGGGVWLGWDRIAQMLSGAPVWAFIGVFALSFMACFTSLAPAEAAVTWSPEAVYSCVSPTYEQTGTVFPC